MSSMRTSSLLLVGAMTLAGLSSVAALVNNKHHHTIHTTKWSEVYDALENGNPTWIDFYAPWCGHCQHFAPRWEDITVRLKKDYSDMNFLTVNCIDDDKYHNSPVCDSFGVEGYPTVYFIKDGKAYKYTEDREEVDFRFFMGRGLDVMERFEPHKITDAPTRAEVQEYVAESVSGDQDDIDDGEVTDDPEGVEGSPGYQPRAVLRLTSENVHEHLSRPEHQYFIKFFTDSCTHCRKLAPTWIKFAKRTRDEAEFHVAEVDCEADADLCTLFGVKGYPTLYLTYDNKMWKYLGGRDLKELDEYRLEEYEKAKPKPLPDLPNTLAIEVES